MGARLLGIAADGALDGPLLLHGHLVLLPCLVGEDSDGLLDGIVTRRSDGLDGIEALEGEGDHDLDGLEVLRHLTQPAPSLHAIPRLSQRGEAPLLALI